MSIVVMGVSGCGKTTVGQALAKHLGRPFFDADDFHPEANVAKMSSGQPLDDNDRRPWLDRLAALLRDEPGAVLACSALKQSYRDRLRQHTDTVTFVHLHAERNAIAKRMADRDHFFPADLLDSQFQALEAPDTSEALVVDAMRPVDQLVADIAARL